MNYDIPAHITGDTWPGLGQISITKNNYPVFLYDSDIVFEVKLDNESPVYLKLTKEANQIVLVQPNLTAFFIPPIIVDIPPGNYIYSITVTTSDGVKTTELTGNWQILPKA